MSRASSRIAAFKLRQPVFRLVAERDDFGQRRAVFAPERVEEIQPLLELLQSRGINVHLFGITGKFGLQLAQRGRRLQCNPTRCARARVHALQFLQGAAHRARLREQRVFVPVQRIQRGLASVAAALRRCSRGGTFLDALVFAG